MPEEELLKPKEEEIQEDLSNRTNKNSKWSFALSIIAIYIFTLIAGITSIVLGIKAIKEIKKTNEKGIVYAIAGIVISSIRILINIVLFSTIFYT